MTLKRRLYVLLAGILLLSSEKALSENQTAPNKAPTITKEPFTNYWDANAWEKGSDKFWSQKKNNSNPKKRTSRNVQKESKVWSRTLTIKIP